MPIIVVIAAIHCYYCSGHPLLVSWPSIVVAVANHCCFRGQPLLLRFRPDEQEVDAAVAFLVDGFKASYGGEEEDDVVAAGSKRCPGGGVSLLLVVVAVVVVVVHH